MAAKKKSETDKKTEAKTKKAPAKKSVKAKEIKSEVKAPACDIKIGFAPTRRAIFSAPAAVEYRKLTAKRLKELNINFVDIDDINEEGLLYDDEGLEKIIAKFKADRVKIMAYVISGFCAAWIGLINTAQLSAAHPCFIMGPSR